MWYVGHIRRRLHGCNDNSVGKDAIQSSAVHFTSSPCVNKARPSSIIINIVADVVVVVVVVVVAAAAAVFELLTLPNLTRLMIAIEIEHSPEMMEHQPAQNPPLPPYISPPYPPERSFSYSYTHTYIFIDICIYIL